MAHEKEEKRVREAQKLAEIKEKISKSRQYVQEDETVAPGMRLDEVNAEQDEERGEETSILHSKKVPKPKTKQQRQKIAKHLAEVRSSSLRALLNSESTCSYGH